MDNGRSAVMSPIHDLYMYIYVYIHIYIYVLYVYSKYKKDVSFNFFSTLFCYLLFRKNIMNS